jgi:hypothetical protein
MTALAIVITSNVVYLVGIGVTFQLAKALEGTDVYGRDSNAYRWLASCVWPITASVAAGIAFARWFQNRRSKPPIAIARDRKTQSR